MTKAIVVVKIPCKLLYIIEVKGPSWPYLISEFLVAYNHYSDWLRTFLQPGYFVQVITAFCKYT